MKTVILKLDLYTKIVLTVIAILLIGLFFQSFTEEKAQAQNPNYVYIANPQEIASTLALWTLDVKVTNVNEIAKAVAKANANINTTTNK